jgi:hypothetical protein
MVFCNMQIGVSENMTHARSSGYHHFTYQIAIFWCIRYTPFQTAAEGALFGLLGLRGLLRERILDKLPLLVLQGTEKDCTFRMEMDTLW